MAESSPGTIIGYHHVAVCVHDIDVARAFYGDVLALEEVERPPEIAERYRSAWYRLGSAELHVLENAKFQTSESTLAPHVAVSSNDFEATVARLQRQGTAFRFGPAPGPDGVLRAVVTDPTGNVFEITDAQPGS